MPSFGNQFKWLPAADGLFSCMANTLCDAAYIIKELVEMEYDKEVEINDYNYCTYSAFQNIRTTNSPVVKSWS